MARQLTRAAARLRDLTTATIGKGKATHTQASVAAAIGVTQQAVCGWGLGVTRPRYEHRIAMERLLGIPSDWWLDASERQALARLASGSRVRPAAGGAR